MKNSTAFEIVLDLASGNALEEEYCEEETLKKQARKQERALKQVEKWRKHFAIKEKK